VITKLCLVLDLCGNSNLCRRSYTRDKLRRAPLLGVLRRYFSSFVNSVFVVNCVCFFAFLFGTMFSSKDKGSMGTEEQSKPLTYEELHAILDKTKLDILQAVEARIDDRMGFSKKESVVNGKESSLSEGMDSSMTKFGDFSMIFKEEEPLDLENDFFANLEPIFDEKPIWLDIPSLQDVFHLNESTPIYDEEPQEKEDENFKPHYNLCFVRRPLDSPSYAHHFLNVMAMPWMDATPLIPSCLTFEPLEGNLVIQPFKKPHEKRGLIPRKLNSFMISQFPLFSFSLKMTIYQEIKD